jgi:hypothetical protein
LGLYPWSRRPGPARANRSALPHRRHRLHIRPGTCGATRSNRNSNRSAKHVRESSPDLPESRASAAGEGQLSSKQRSSAVPVPSTCGDSLGQWQVLPASGVPRAANERPGRRRTRLYAAKTKSAWIWDEKADNGDIGLWDLALSPVMDGGPGPSATRPASGFRAFGRPAAHEIPGRVLTLRAPRCYKRYVRTQV